MCEDRKDVMPTYQYVCGQCDAPLEAVQSFSDDALTTCPVCNADALRKVYGSVGVVFKGSGFYRNDSRGTSTSVTPSTSDSSSSAGSPAASSKPAAKAAESKTPAAPSTPAASSSPSAS
jgi:putative FmdB family regulatory protein